jgi:hypothetical protein
MLMPMFPLQLRLAYFFHPKVLLSTVAVAAIGYLAIQGFGKDQLAGFHLSSPNLAPVEATLRGIFTERYSEIALGWIASTIGVAWLFAGKQAKKALRIMEAF